MLHGEIVKKRVGSEVKTLPSWREISIYVSAGKGHLCHLYGVEYGAFRFCTSTRLFLQLQNRPSPQVQPRG